MTAAQRHLAIAANQHSLTDVAIRNQDDSNPMYYLDIFPAIKKGSDDQTPWTPAIIRQWPSTWRKRREVGKDVS